MSHLRVLERSSGESAAGTNRGRGWGSEDGSMLVELPAYMFALILLLWVSYGGMRVLAVKGDVAASASAAARAASGSYSASAGAGEAHETALAMLQSDLSQRCGSVNVATSGSWSPGGQVQVTVTCVVSLAEVTGVGFGQTRTYRATAVEHVESVRGG